MEDVLAQIASAEEGQRGYLITGDTSHLEPFNKANSNVMTDISNLRILLKGDKDLTVKLNKYDSLITSRFKSLQETIDVRSASGFDAAVERLKLKIGKKYMDKIYEQTTRIEADKYNLLQKRDQLLVTNVKNTFITIIVGTLLSCIIFLTVFYIFDREIGERKKVEAAIRREMEFSDRLLNSSIDGILAFDGNCNVTLWNPGVVRR